jgi:GNAT superfamily N-acetyltransferase
MNWFKKVSFQYSPDLEAILNKWRQIGVDLFVFEFDDKITLDMIVVPPKIRKQGIGSQIMSELVNYADSVGKRLELSPANKGDYEGTTSRNRLIDFYKRFGLVENKGKNKDYTTNKTMYREPKI